MIIPVNNVAQFGLITDLPPNELPLNAWTAGRNIRFRDGAVEKFSGHVEVYATPTWAPYWLLPVAKDSNYFWVYAGTSKIGATDGVTHADITRAAGGDYTTDLDIGWTGCVIERIAVLNNGFDVPQMWTPALANDCAALTGWTSTHSARVMRGLKRYLVALDITKSGVRYPQMIKWSDEAPTNGVPTSWDETSTTNDAGEWSLGDEGGFLTDAIPLGEDLIIYKEYQTYAMKYVGGIDIFDFPRRFKQIGMLAPKCGVEFFDGQHLVFTGEDVVLHNGQRAESIIQQKLVNSISGLVDSTNYKRCFVALNYPKKEAWICFPEIGNSTPNKALVWNWKDNTWGVRDLPNAAFIESGIVDPVTTAETWAGASGTWATDTDAWQDRNYDPSQRRMLMAVPGSTKLFTLDNTQQFNSSNMTSYVEKTAIGFPVKKDGPPDYTTEKVVTRIWPRIRGTAGGIVNVYLGTQDRVNGSVTWQTAFPFTIGTTEDVDPDPANASKLHAIKFESTGDVQWMLDGYDVEVMAVGSHGNR